MALEDFWALGVCGSSPWGWKSLLLFLRFGASRGKREGGGRSEFNGEAVKTSVGRMNKAFAGWGKTRGKMIDHRHHYDRKICIEDRIMTSLSEQALPLQIYIVVDSSGRKCKI